MLSRLDNEMLSITPAIVNPVTLVLDTLKMLDGDVRSGSIQTTVICADSLNAHNIEKLFCDPIRLTQILTNLLSNAFKFTRNEKTRLVEVTCGASLKDPTEELLTNSLQWSSTREHRVDLTVHSEWGQGQTVYPYFLVRDTGVGMTSQEVGRLFARFSQATTTTYIKYGGTGLGLYISRELAEKHGGQVGVQSEPGKGSTFAFYVKARRAPATQPVLEQVLEDSTDSKLINRLEDLRLSPEKERPYEVLLVEDNVINQQVLSRQLRKAGCIVHTANDGLEALDFFDQHAQQLVNGTKEPRSTLDVILMDWNMPNLDGVSCTRRIRQAEREKIVKEPIAIIGITANARPEQLLEAQNAGMDSVVSKPFLLADLMVKIRLLVKR